ncbi:MAG: hypothetical protein ABSG68_04755 [Thermoguttaceae bacterium]|jgi:hypothetical protein
MSHPLQEKMRALRVRVRRLMAAYGLAVLLAAVLGVVILLGLGDYLIRIQDRGLRVICSLLAAATAAAACYHYLYSPLALRLRDLDLALRLRRHFPAMEDRLLSAIEFLRQAEDDPMAGSAALRRSVISQATAESERLDFSQALDYRPVLRAGLAAAAICVVAAVLAVLDPSAARIAVTRLVNPLGETAWPQITHLELRRTLERVARGQPFEIEAVDAQGARLPSEVRIHYRFQAADGTKTSETQRMQLLGDVMVARRENITLPFSYWVEGGDDRSLPWIAVEVVDPPVVTGLSVDIFPPAYTGWPMEKSDGSVRALVGSRLRIAGEAAVPLSSAEMHLEDGRRLRGRLSEDRRHFLLEPPPPAAGDSAHPLVVDKSGAYWFLLTDEEGLSGGSDNRWEIHAVADAPPSITIEQPAANLFVTPRARVAVRIAAKDDLALRAVAFVYTRSDQPKQDEASTVLYRGPEHVAPQPKGGLIGDALAGDRRMVEHLWDLEPLKLPPGSQVVFCATAQDYRLQTGKSEPRRLMVITPEELQERIAGRQNLILAELARVLKMQRDSRAQGADLQIRLKELGRLEQLDVDHLQAAELNQRQVGRSLTSRSDGVPMHVLALLADLENNRIDSPDIQRRMQALLDEIDRLDREHLPAIGRELTAAIKAAQVRLQDAAGAPKAIADPLAAAVKHQDAVIASLEAILGQLTQWDNYRRFTRDLGQLLRDQEEVAQRTVQVGRHTLTKEPKDLLPDESADLKILSGRQLELARRLDLIEQEMEQAGRDLRPSDPLAADTVIDALEEARRLGLGGDMRSAGSQLEENRIGRVSQSHQEIQAGLQDVLDILAGRREPELARLVKKLQEARGALDSLLAQQVGLRKNMAENAQSPNPAETERLRREQQRLRQEAERMARRLERLLAQEASRATAQAAAQMGQAAVSADAANMHKQGLQAEKSLEEARTRLAAKLSDVQAQLVAEQMARLEDTVRHLHGQQQGALEETRRIDALGRDQGHLTRAQAASLLDLLRTQQLLQADTARTAEQLAAAPAFHNMLSAAAARMERAAALLDGHATGPDTQQAQQQAIARLAMLLEALKPDTPAAKPGDPQQGGAGQGGGGQPGTPLSLAELKLLKLMQEDINARTRQLQEQIGAAKELTARQLREYNELSDEQGRLADMVLQLLKPAPNPEDRPPAEPEEGKKPRQEDVP